jgi:hypothetical protein
MSEHRKANIKDRQVAVVIGATSKWQSDGRNTLLAHGWDRGRQRTAGRRALGASGCHRAEVRAGGFFVVLTTRTEANAADWRRPSGSKAATAWSSSWISYRRIPSRRHSPRSVARQASLTS